jgi:hypothetical protein
MEGDCPEWFPNRHPEKYLCLYATDSLTTNILDWYPTFEETLRKFLRHGTGVVYVHCQAGMNRSGSLALAYVCKNFCLPLDEVVTATRRQRPVLFQNPVFMKQVKEFINGCLSRSENTRLDIDRVHDRNSGLFTSDHSSGVERLLLNAGEPAYRVGSLANDHLRPILGERPGFDCQSESNGGESEINSGRT